MKPVVTPDEMADIDADAPEPVEELIERAGWATARAAADLLDRRLYGKRIVVLVGKGNNGADGHSAARFLEQRGASCTIVDFAGSDRARPAPGHRWDLVIDACVGTGLGRAFDRDALPVSIGDAPVLAVDIPSGVDGAPGRANGTPIPAAATVTFAAPKPGLLFHPGRGLAGVLTVADIGLDCSRAATHLVEAGDVRDRWPTRSPTDHKRSRSVLVVGGSPGLTGAPSLVAAGALRSGVGHVTVSIPGTERDDSARVSEGEPVERGPVPTEAIEEAIPLDWADPLLDRLETGPPVGAIVIGPGLATDPRSQHQVRRYLASSRTPTVLDAGAIHALTPDRPSSAAGPDGSGVSAASTGSGRATRPAHALPDDPGPGAADDSPPPTLTPLPAPFDPDGSVRHVLTPHDGEFRVLTGRLPGPDRIADCRRAAAGLGAIVLLKGPTTVVAHPDGRVLLSTAGDERLATAGSGDVLAGLIAAALAGGLEPLEAAALGAELHGIGACTGYRVGLVAGDLPSLIAEALSS